jgi:hypothetical protein
MRASASCADIAVSQGRLTDRDTAAAELLSTDMSRSERDELFTVLQNLRADQGGLSTSDLLRRRVETASAGAARPTARAETHSRTHSFRDYKEWLMGGWKVGIASIGLPLSTLAARGGADSPAVALAATADARGLDLLLLMTAHGEGASFERELASYSHPGSCFAAEVLPLLTERLSLSDDLHLERAAGVEWPTPGTAHVQRNTRASRKVLQPLLDELLSSPALEALNFEANKRKPETFLET